MKRKSNFKKKGLSTALILGTYLYSGIAFGQVGVGTQTPNASSQLEIVSNDRGLLIPKISLQSTTDATSITNGNVDGLTVYNTNNQADVTPGYYYWNTNKWFRLLNDEDVSVIAGQSITSFVVVGQNVVLTTSGGSTFSIPASDLEPIVNTDNQSITDFSIIGSNLSITIENGNTVSVPLSTILANETTSTLVNNGDGSYTYTDETGASTVIDVVSDIMTYGDTLLTNSTFVQAMGDTIINNSNIMNNLVTNQQFIDSIVNIIGNTETITSFVDNGNGTFTFFNENGVPTVLNLMGATGPQGPIGLTGATGAQGPAGNDGAVGPQGPIGLTGAQGPIGLTGATGAQGPIGLTGAQGPIGLTGATGAQGPIGLTGAQGPIGLTGAQGPIGLTGPAGTNGIDGAVGAVGPQGPIGLTGATGAQGPAGNDGAVGPQGPIGLTGATGAQGPAGNDGAVGPQGPIGLTGATGAQGPAGNDGAVGPQGPIGLTGATGAQGPAGNDGAVGPQGPIGLTGATGAQGPAGNDGAVGPQGPIGLTGATGAQGPAGNDGAVGPQGPIGLTGATGAQGPIGLTGAAGTNGRSVLSGTTNPVVATGAVGDFYINTATNTLFGPKTGAGWPAGVSLVGATGATGPQGPQGPTGAQGPTGLLPNGTAAGNTPYWNGTSWVVNSSNIFNNGGNVGIGTETPGALYELEVKSNVTAFGNATLALTSSANTSNMHFEPSSSGTTAYNNITSPGDARIIFSTDGNASVAANNGLVIAPHSAGAVPASGIKIMENGNVGVGETAPTAKLDVNGTARVQDLPAAVSTDVPVYADANGNLKKGYQSDDWRLAISHNPATDFGWSTNAETIGGQYMRSVNNNTIFRSFWLPDPAVIGSYTQYMVTFSYHCLDSWDEEKAIVEVTGNLINARWLTYSENSDDITGLPGSYYFGRSWSFADRTFSGMITGAINGQSLVIYVGSDLDQAPGDEGFAISNINIWVR